MNDGNVNSSPTASRMKAATLTLTIGIVFVAHARFRASQLTIQMMMASVDTPESLYRATPQGRKALSAAKDRVRELFGELIEGK